MNQRIHQLVRTLLPFPMRRWLRRVRDLQGPGDIFGRWSAGGLQAAISGAATARRWRHVAIGVASTVEHGTHFHSNDDNAGIRIEVGDHCFIGQNCFFSAGEKIVLENYCTIGASCNLLAAGHRYDDPSVPYARAAVISYGRMQLDSNTWIGAGSTLVGDIQLGYGSIVAAGSLLRTPVPPLCLVAGNPARIIKVFDWPTQTWIRLPDNQPACAAALARHLSTIPTKPEYLSQLKA